MSRRDEVVEAMAEAMDAAYNPDRYPIMAAMFRDYADAGLDAALAVLHPTVPNDAAVLDALPVGTVLRGDDGSVRTRAPGGGWVKGAFLTGVRTADLVNIGTYKRVTEWLVIYQPEEGR